MRRRVVLALAVLLTGPARADPEPPRPTWPVPNPKLEAATFRPGAKDRLVSGVFGPRLKWGEPRYDHHEGLDFFAFFEGAPAGGAHDVLAILPGVVTQVIDPADPEATETGRKVVVTHDVPWARYGAPAAWGKVKSGYLHLSRVDVREGEQVGAGQRLGAAGETGHTSTVHLHLNVYRAGEGGRDVNVNPARLFAPGRFRRVAPLARETVEAAWLERDRAAGTVLVRVLLPVDAWTLDGLALEVDGDASRALSFEAVSAEQRARRDRGDRDLVPGLRVFPLRCNGGGDLAELNAPDSLPADWPARRFPPARGLGPRLAFDLLGTELAAGAREVAVHVTDVGGQRLTFRPPRR